MKAVVIDKFITNYNELHVSEVASPAPKDDEVLIQVKAAGVNFVDTLYARGLHQNNRRHVKPPFTLGLEFAGVVISSPPSSPYRAGDRVFGACEGSYSQYITLPSSVPLQPIPPSWSFADAAGLAATLPVSYGALSLRSILKRDETVLVHAAAGGLGLAAVQIARALGCRVIGTAGSDAKCRIAEKFGAHKCINYSSYPKWWEDVLAATDGNGADVVYDSVGLVGDSIRCLAHRGRVLIVGFAGREGNMEGVKMNRVLLKQANLIGYRFGESVRRDPTVTSQIWKELWPLIESGAIKPTIYDQQYAGLENVPRALQDIAGRKVWGKAVIHVDQVDTNDQKAKL